MTNPTPERPRDVADMPPEERERQYHAAMAAADVDAAEVSFAGRCPRTGPKDVRRPWGRGGTWSPCSGGSTGPAERPHERADGAATSPHIILEIEAAAKERGETVSGWRRATLIEAVAVEGRHDTIERRLEAATPLPPPGSAEWLRDEALSRAREPDPDR